MGSVVDLYRAEESSVFAVGQELDHEGVHIVRVFLDDVQVDESQYVKIGPRQVSFKISIPDTVAVTAAITEL